MLYGIYQSAGSNVVNNIARFDSDATIVVSAESLVKHQTVKVYPNPAHNILNITTTTHQFNIQLSDITGKIIYAETINDNNTGIDVSSYSKGIYFLQVNSNAENNTVYKVVVE